MDEYFMQVLIPECLYPTTYFTKEIYEYQYNMRKGHYLSPVPHMIKERYLAVLNSVESKVPLRWQVL